MITKLSSKRIFVRSKVECIWCFITSCWNWKSISTKISKKTSLQLIRLFSLFSFYSLRNLTTIFDFALIIESSMSSSNAINILYLWLKKHWSKLLISNISSSWTSLSFSTNFAWIQITKTLLRSLFFWIFISTKFCFLNSLTIRSIINITWTTFYKITSTISYNAIWTTFSFTIKFVKFTSNMWK